MISNIPLITKFEISNTFLSFSLHEDLAYTGLDNIIPFPSILVVIVRDSSLAQHRSSQTVGSCWNLKLRVVLCRQGCQKHVTKKR